MAGNANNEDDPVAINSTALIDVIFCLCLFYMCSFHFKGLEGKVESWLPKGHGVHTGPLSKIPIDDVRLSLDVDPATGAVETRFGARRVESRAHLDELLRETRAEVAALGRKEARAVIDATPRVPWQAVIHAIDRARASAFEVELAGQLAATR